MFYAWLLNGLLLDYIAVTRLKQSQDTSDIVTFHHVLNEIYPKQVLKKVRQVKRNSAEQGKFMGSHAPYGYQKSPEDKHKLIVDEYAASIVRRIFRDFCCGDSARLIGEHLTQEGIDSPRFYSFGKNNGQKPKAGEQNNWCSSTVLQILKNQVYIGDMVQHKRQVVSFKTKKRRAVDPSEWIVVHDTHEAIIGRNTWEDANQRFAAGKHRVRKTKAKDGKPCALFSGCLVCADCGAKLTFQSKPKTGAYRCSRYNNAGTSACSTHFIMEETIADFVLHDIQQYAILAKADRTALENKLIKTMNCGQHSEARQLESRQREIERRQLEIIASLKSLYEDKCKGTLTVGLFQSLATDYAREQSDSFKPSAGV